MAAFVTHHGFAPGSHPANRNPHPSPSSSATSIPTSSRPTLAASRQPPTASRSCLRPGSQRLVPTVAAAPAAAASVAAAPAASPYGSGSSSNSPLSYGARPKLVDVDIGTDAEIYGIPRSEWLKLQVKRRGV